MSFHNEAIEIAYPLSSATSAPSDKVKFEPFFGVGPRKFFALFSMDIGAGRQLVRKEKPLGAIKEWSPDKAKVRVQMMKDSYLQREKAAAERFGSIVGQLPYQPTPSAA
jgi:hypothetical protein